MISLTYQDFYVTRRKRFSEKIHVALRKLDQREDFMEAMRGFKKKEERELKQAFDHHSLSLEELLIGLTALAEVCLEAVCFFEEEILQSLYGQPKSHLQMIAMGKFGGYEITLQSDLDLIFLFTDHGETSGSRVLTHQEYYVRLVQRIISNLSLMTQSGFVYKVDAKLRPSGRAGVLVSSWASFEDYHKRDARLWEKQALLKARAISSDLELKSELRERIARQIWDRDYEPQIAQEIHDLRLRMEQELAQEGPDQYNIKAGVGGIVDIEFTVQYLQLVHGQEYPEVRSPHTLTALRLLALKQIMSPERAELLEEAYLFYRLVETQMREVRERVTEQFPKEGATGERIAQACGEMNFDGLRKKYETFRHDVRLYYLETLGLG